MHWILQDNLFNEEAYKTLLDTLVRFNIAHSIHKVIPFIGELTPEPYIEDERAICMGSYSMRHVAKRNGWYPGVFDLEPFDFTVQLQHWGKHMLNHDAIVGKFGEIEFNDDVAFIRPIQDSKVFAGRLIRREEFLEWQNKVCVLGENYGDSLSSETLIQVCKPKKIYAEYRFWIVDQMIVSASLYKRGDKVIYSSDVDSRFYVFVTQILRTKDQQLDTTLSVVNHGWRPHDAFVLDVADTDEGIKVVEINTLNASGFYACDIQQLVLTLEDKFGKVEYD